MLFPEYAQGLEELKEKWVSTEIDSPSAKNNQGPSDSSERDRVEDVIVSRTISQFLWREVAPEEVLTTLRTRLRGQDGFAESDLDRVTDKIINNLLEKLHGQR